MCDVLDWLYGALKSIEWLEVIRSLAPVVTAFAAVATAFIAYRALRNWQRQDKAKREAEFLDEMIEAVHAYIAEINRPVQMLEFSKMGMESHVKSWEQGEETEKAINGAIAYIQKRGESDGKRLLDVLGGIRSSTIELRSLIVKGQVFKFDGYAKCQGAIDLLIWTFNRIEAFAIIIASPSWNWDNPEVMGRLKSEIALDPKELHKYVHDSNVAIVEFVRDNYIKIYG